MTRMIIDFILILGFSILCGMVIPRKNGPFNIFRVLKVYIGKPFTCSVCMAIWSAAFVTPLLYFFPFLDYSIMLFSAAGFAILSFQWSQFDFIEEEG